MSRYFSKYPIVSYKNKEIRNISRRSKFRDSVLFDPYIFLPYTIREGEKPETIAADYYGSVDDTWLVLLANGITDPYTEWPLDDKEFDEYFIDKYSELSTRTGFDVIRWGQDRTITENIIYYYKEIDKSLEKTFTIDSGSSSLTVTEDQLEEILNDQVVTIDGIQYRLVEE